MAKTICGFQKQPKKYFQSCKILIDFSDGPFAFDFFKKCENSGKCEYLTKSQIKMVRKRSVATDFCEKSLKI